jgi:hypothetical protein
MPTGVMHAGNMRMRVANALVPMAMRMRLGHTWCVSADGARRAAGNRIVLVMSEPVRYETRVRGSDVAVERCRRMEP